MSRFNQTKKRFNDRHYEFARVAGCLHGRHSRPARNYRGVDAIRRIPVGIQRRTRCWGFRNNAKLLIPFERRDVRVVEGARLEIALTVCDGVLQISITVADPES